MVSLNFEEYKENVIIKSVKLDFDEYFNISSLVRINTLSLSLSLLFNVKEISLLSIVGLCSPILTNIFSMLL